MYVTLLLYCIAGKFGELGIWKFWWGKVLRISLSHLTARATWQVWRTWWASCFHARFVLCNMSASASFAIDAVIRRYHVYKEFGLTPWTTCERKVGNSHDPLAVAVKKLIDGNNTIVGYVLRRISPLCSVFIRRGGSITYSAGSHKLPFLCIFF